MSELVISWDQTERSLFRAEEIMAGLPEYSMEQALEEVAQDSEWWEWEWNDEVENLTEILKKISRYGYFHIEVKNFGWRNQDGSTVIKAKDGQDFINKVLPDTDNTFKIFKEGNTLKIQNWHHDSPTGNEWYIIRKALKKEFDNN